MKYPGWSPYCFVMNTPIQAIDPDGRRVYFVGGAGLDTDGWGYTDRWGKAFAAAGIKGFTPLRNVSHDKPGTFPAGDVSFTASQFRSFSSPSTTVSSYNSRDPLGSSRGVYTQQVKVTDEMVEKAANQIVADLAKNPLGDGEQLNLTGYSYGSVLQAHVALKLNSMGHKVNNLVLVGSPISSDSELFGQLQSITNVIREDIPGDELSDPSGFGEFMKGGLRSSPIGDGDNHEHFDLARPGAKADKAIQKTVNDIKSKGVE